MAQEIVKDYETVEKERTITVCDNCGRTDEESEMVTVAINPQKKLKRSENLHLVETFEDDYEAQKFIKEHQRHNNRYGVAWNQHEQITDMNASATADVCSSCLTKLFDIDVDPEDIDNINIRDGEIKINTIEKKISIWPDIPEWDNSTYPTCNWGWKGKIIGWPMSFIATWIEWGLTDDERQKGYVAGFLGAFLWFSLLFILLFILL